MRSLKRAAQSGVGGVMVVYPLYAPARAVKAAAIAAGA
jgi:hypothetical protein